MCEMHRRAEEWPNKWYMKGLQGVEAYALHKVESFQQASIETRQTVDYPSFVGHRYSKGSL